MFQELFTLATPQKLQNFSILGLLIATLRLSDLAIGSKPRKVCPRRTLPLSIVAGFFCGAYRFDIFFARQWSDQPEPCNNNKAVTFQEKRVARRAREDRSDFWVRHGVEGLRLDNKVMHSLGRTQNRSAHAMRRGLDQ